MCGVGPWESISSRGYTGRREREREGAPQLGRGWCRGGTKASKGGGGGGGGGREAHRRAAAAAARKPAAVVLRPPSRTCAVRVCLCSGLCVLSTIHCCHIYSFIFLKVLFTFDIYKNKKRTYK